MEENSQWQAFVQTGDIRYYLQYKEEQLQNTATLQTQKDLSDGCICDTGTRITRNQI